MKKKSGLVEIMVKVGIVAAGIGGTLYLLKDKIEENPKCKEAVDKVKNAIKKHMPEKEEPMDETDLFDEDFDEIIHTSGSKERGYVNIKLSNDEDVEETAEDIMEDVKDAAEDIAEDVKDAAKDIAEDVKDAVEDIVEDVKDAGEDIAEAIEE